MQTGLREGLTSFRLAAGVPGPADGTSLYRAIGPLAAMRQQDRRFDFLPCGFDLDNNPRMTWDWMMACDAVFVQRPMSPPGAQACVTARLLKKPVWVDWDDELGNVPRYNPAYSLYPVEKIAPTLNMIMRLADVVTVSTEAIRQARCEGKEELLAKTVVIPNAMIWDTPPIARRRKLILWRGMGNHDADLLDFLPVMAEVARLPLFHGWKFYFLGQPAWQIYDTLPPETFEFDPGADAFLYYELLCRLAPYIVIRPHRTIPFNLARSNIAWLEATGAGAVTVAPDWPEWQRPGVVNYDGRDQYRDRLIELIKTWNEGEPHPNVALSRDWIAANVAQGQINAKRWEIINQMADGKWKMEVGRLPA
jgi:hypothetical protein